MANFEKAYSQMLKNEGGYVLSHLKNDRGGQTYAGIARTKWPDWPGWRHVDAGQIPPTELVREFYRVNFWNVIRGEEIQDDSIAGSLLSFAANAGDRVAVKLAQVVVGVEPDGRVGPKTLAALNSIRPEVFRPTYALAKVARYRDIVTKDRSQLGFLLGWLNRTLGDL